MLLNDFFTISKIDKSENYEVQISLNSSHKIFEGHFPQNPVVPGVCMTQMLKEIIENIENVYLTMISGDNIKFTSVLNPNIHPSCTFIFRLKENENGLLITNAKLSSGDINFFSFKGSFKKENI